MTTETGSYHPLLDDLDARQDDLLEQLDQLNQRIELLLTQFTAAACVPVRPSVPEPADATARAVPGGLDLFTPVEMAGLADRAQETQGQEHGHEAAGQAEE